MPNAFPKVGTVVIIRSEFDIKSLPGGSCDYYLPEITKSDKYFGCVTKIVSIRAEKEKTYYRTELEDTHMPDVQSMHPWTISCFEIIHVEPDIEYSVYDIY